MTKRPAILVTIGTRPEAVKLAPVVRALHDIADVTVVATAQHRGMLDRLFTFFDIRPAVDLDLMQPSQDLAGLTSRALAAMDRTLVEHAPDLVLAQGDTTSVFATALGCFYRRIPFGHVEAGLRSHDLDGPFPEELNRIVAGRIAALHFAPTERARDNLLAEGVDAAQIVVTGNTVVDALLWTRERVTPPPRRAGVRRLLVTAHRRESHGLPLRSICMALRDLAARTDVEILFPVHPNPAVDGPVRELLTGVPRIELSAPLDYPDFVAALAGADLVLTDSGGVQEEAPYLGVPVLVLRDSTERGEAVDQSAARVVGTDRLTIAAAANRLLDDAQRYAAMATPRAPFGDGGAALRIRDAITAWLAGRVV